MPQELHSILDLIYHTGEHQVSHRYEAILLGLQSAEVDELLNSVDVDRLKFQPPSSKLKYRMQTMNAMNICKICRE
jgi:hypothetical protein